MASLKEVKGRIASVNNTRKITSAMKMVASAKLHKAQAAIENMLPYERRLNHILTNFLSADSEVESPFIVSVWLSSCLPPIPVCVAGSMQISSGI